jgi:hypothetical protein
MLLLHVSNCSASGCACQMFCRTTLLWLSDQERKILALD